MRISHTITRVFSILLALGLLAGCGSSTSSASNSTNAASDNATSSNTAASDNESNDPITFDAEGMVYNQDGISVTVAGVYYDEDSYTWYFTWSGTNNTDTQVVISAPYVALNGYRNIKYGPSLIVPPHETVEEETTIEKPDLCYYCELMGENTIRDVDLTIKVYEDPDGDGNIDSYSESLLGESNGVVTASVEPLVISDEQVEGTESTVVIDDDSCRVSFVGVGDDLYGVAKNPLLYIIIENISDDDITYSYDSNSQSFEDILEGLTSDNTCLINDEAVKCGLLYGDLPVGGKTLETIELYLSDSDITVDGIEKIEYPIEITKTETLEDIASYILTIE